MLAVIGLAIVGNPSRIEGIRQDRAVKARSRPHPKEPSPLAGILFDHTGDRLTPSHAVKKGRRYRYYIANRLIREKKNADGLRLLSTPE